MEKINISGEGWRLRDAMDRTFMRSPRIGNGSRCRGSEMQYAVDRSNRSSRCNKARIWIVLSDGWVLPLEDPEREKRSSCRGVWWLGLGVSASKDGN